MSAGNSSNGAGAQASAAPGLHGAQVKLAQGDYSGLAAALEQALASRPDDLPLIVALGAARLWQEDLEAARLQFVRALELQPDHLPACAGLANVLIALGRLDEARLQLSRLLEKSPSDLALLKLFARLSLACDRFEEGIQAFDKVIQVSPADVDARLVLAACFAEAGDAGAANKIYRQVFEANNPWAFSEEYLSGLLEAQLAREESAALGFSHQQAQLLRIGTVAASQGNWGLALEHFSKLLRYPDVNPLIVEPLKDKVRYFLSKILPDDAPAAATPGAQPVAAAIPAAPGDPLRSRLCRQEDFEQPWFKAALADIRTPVSYHRKHWEYVFIIRALAESGCLAPGSRGLGFGVGREALVAYFAGRGCRLLATDLAAAEAAELGWVESNQHSDSIAALYVEGLCDFDKFSQQVEFRSVDMNHIPEDLLAGQFDFTWSTCSFEHVGSIELGKQFILNQMRCLRPGGVAVHTTEFNLSSNEFTIDNQGTVLFRRRDIEDLAESLRAAGHSIELDLDPGNGRLDQYADVPPYFVPGGIHLKLLLDKYVTTSIGLVIQKAAS